MEKTSVKFAPSRDAQARQWAGGGRAVVGLEAEQVKEGLGNSRGVREVVAATKLLTRLIKNKWK